jgi:hypothetical protein
MLSRGLIASSTRAGAIESAARGLEGMLRDAEGDGPQVPKESPQNKELERAESAARGPWTIKVICLERVFGFRRSGKIGVLDAFSVV